jgi:cobalt-zinc-cadmium efflux system outer membrane protein
MLRVETILIVVLSGVLIPRPGLSQTNSRHVPTIAAGSTSEEIPAGLSLESLEQIALERNPTLVQAGAQVRISRGKAIQAGLYPNPQIGYAGEQIGIAGTAGELQGMFIEQEIVTGHKLQLSRAKFMQEAREAELQVMAQQYRVLHSVRVAYYNALAQQQRLDVRRELRGNSDEAAKTVKELVNVGQANQSDVLQAEVAAQRAKVNLQMSESRYRSSWEELTAVIGMPDMPPTHLEGKLDFQNGKPLDRDATLADLLACSPELLVARAEVARGPIGCRERTSRIHSQSECSRRDGLQL